MLARAEGTLAVRVSLPTNGVYVDAHARAGGKVLLAYAPEDLREEYLARHHLRPLTPSTIVDQRQFEAELERIRERGYGFDEEEFIAGVSCIAVPIIRDGVLFVYSISLPAQRFVERRQELTRALTATAKAAAEG